MNNLRKLLLLAFVFSGAAALIYQVTWIRPLQFLLGSTTYTISIIFSAFMAGLALGSFIVSKHVDNIRNLPKTYALFEIGIGLYGLLLLSIFNVLPGIYDSLYFLHTNFYLFEFVQFLLVFLLLLVPTTLMGATFPIVVRYYTEKRIGKAIGEAYAANNLGAIIGSFAAGFVLIPLIGIKGSIIFAGIINIIIGTIIILKSEGKNEKGIIMGIVVLFIALSFIGSYNIQQMHYGGFYRTDDIYEDLGSVVYYEEGIYATVTVRETLGSGKALFINGKGQGSSAITDLRVNFLLAYLPQLIKPETENALVIGLGTGTTSGQVSQFSNVKTVEIEPDIIGAVPYFNTFNNNILKNPNHELVIDDGRNYLLRNKEKYGVIIQEPSDPWQSFSSSLYSKKFFELVKEDLTDDGMFIKWVPIYTMSPEDFKNFYKTFDSVFPYNFGFVNIKSDEDTPVRFDASEIILVGSKEQINIDLAKFKENYDKLPSASKQQLNTLKLDSGEHIYHLLLFNNEQMGGYADNAKLVTDDMPILEFSTAKEVLNQNPKEVIDDIEQFIQR